MERIVKSAPSGSETEAEFLWNQWEAEEYYGHLRKARRLLPHAIQLLRSNHNNAGAAIFLIESATLDASLGNPIEAHRAAAEGMSLLGQNKLIDSLAALTYARLGDLHQAQRLVNELARRYPNDTLVNRRSISSDPGSHRDQPEPSCTSYRDFGRHCFFRTGESRSCEYAGPSLSAHESRKRGRGRVSEDSRPSGRRGGALHAWTGGTSWCRTGLRDDRRHHQSENSILRLLDALERRRPRHPRFEAGQIRVREVAITKRRVTSRSRSVQNWICLKT